MDYSITRYVGKWVNKIGKTIVIRKVDECTASVDYLFFNGQPHNRPYYKNAPTVDLVAAYDEYYGGFSVDLWSKEKGFQLDLSFEYAYELDSHHRDALVPSLSNFENDRESPRHHHIFSPLDHYIRLNAEQGAAKDADKSAPLS